MSVARAIDVACEQAQAYADELARAQREILALSAELARLQQERRDLKLLLMGNMPMTALDYLNLNDHPQTHH